MRIIGFIIYLLASFGITNSDSLKNTFWIEEKEAIDLDKGIIPGETTIIYLREDGKYKIFNSCCYKGHILNNTLFLEHGNPIQQGTWKLINNKILFRYKISIYNPDSASSYNISGFDLIYKNGKILEISDLPPDTTNYVPLKYDLDSLSIKIFNE
jgi:hypothetical protein